MATRRVGLSRFQPTSSLLRTINGKPTKEPESFDVLPLSKSTKEPESFDALPLSSDEEEEAGRTTVAQADSSADEGPARGEIRPTNFRPTLNLSRGSSLTGPRGAGVGRTGRTGQGGLVSSKKGDEGFEDSDSSISEPSRAKKLHITSQKMSNTLGGHLKDDPFKNSRTIAPAYGKGAKPRPRMSYGKMSSTRESRTNTPQRIFKAPLAPSSPESTHQKKTFTSQHAKTKAYETPSPVKGNLKRRDAGSSSPDKTLEKPRLRVFSGHHDELPSRKKPRKEARLRRQADGDQSETDLPQSPKSPPPPVFKIPGSDLPSRRLNPETLPLEAGEIDEENLIGDDGDSFLNLGVKVPTAAPLCPMCDEPVDRDLLDRFSKNARMSITQQTKFCRVHKKRSAREAWVSHGYPDIDWSKLPQRIGQHYAVVQAIVEGQRSHYGDILREKVATGQNRTILKTEDSTIPGYYGPRGLQFMSESLVKKFSALLRKRAVEDRLISARGHTVFVQAVLVPELAVRLIMEDVGVDEDAARCVLTDSAWVGELLNEDAGDVVLNDEGTASEAGSLLDSD